MSWYQKYFPLLIFFTAAMIGALYLLPHFFIYRAIENRGGTYLFLQYGDEINSYMARAREVHDGRFPPSDLTFEGKPTILNPLPSLIFSLFISGFRGNIQSAYFAVVGVFVGVIFLLFYWLGKIFIQRRAWAWCIAIVAVLTTLARSIPYAFFSISNFINIFAKNFYPGVQTLMDRLPLFRFDDPLLTMPFFLITIGGWYIFWTHPTRRHALYAGCMSSIMFYVYFHNWVYIIVLSFVLFLISCIYFRQNPGRTKYFLIVFSTIGLFAIPYIFQYRSFMNLSASQDYIARIGLLVGHGFNREAYPYYIAFLLFVIGTYKVFFKHNKEKALFYFGNIIASVGVLNTQVITGSAIIPENWVRSFGIIFFILFWDLLYTLAKSMHKVKIATIIFFIFTALLIGKKTVNATLFIRPPEGILPYYEFNQKVLDSFDWINKNLPHEPIIISDSYVTTDFLTSYTSARPFMPTGANAIVSNRILEERFLQSNAYFEVPVLVLHERLIKSQIGPNWKTPELLKNLNLYNAQGYLYTNFYSDNNYQIPPDKIEDLEKQYKNLHPEWKNIDAEYLYLGPFEKMFSVPRFTKQPNLGLVFDNGEVEIYKIQK